MPLSRIPIQVAGGGAWITVHAYLYVAQGSLHKRDRKNLEGWLANSLRPHIVGSNAAILGACRKAAEQAGSYRTFGRHPLLVHINIVKVEPCVEAANYNLSVHSEASGEVHLADVHTDSSVGTHHPDRRYHRTERRMRLPRPIHAFGAVA